MKIKETIRFPCGYEIEIEEVSNPFFETHRCERLLPNVCPLHGKSCRRIR